jgi:hypothetical protein
MIVGYRAETLKQKTVSHANSYVGTLAVESGV